MKLLFLDVDGVLNSQSFSDVYKRVHAVEAWRTEELDPVAVARLNDLTERTRAQLVISSTWRIGRALSELQTLLKGKGVRGEIVGATPRLHRTPDGVPKVRGDEIQAYLDQMPLKPYSFAIVDDSADMAHLLPKLVQTTWERGLEPEHVERLVWMLNHPSRPVSRVA